MGKPAQKRWIPVMLLALADRRCTRARQLAGLSPSLAVTWPDTKWPACALEEIARFACSHSGASLSAQDEWAYMMTSAHDVKNSLCLAEEADEQHFEEVLWKLRQQIDTATGIRCQVTGAFAGATGMEGQHYLLAQVSIKQRACRLSLDCVHGKMSHRLDRAFFSRGLFEAEGDQHQQLLTCWKLDLDWVSPQVTALRCRQTSQHGR
jgi:hypothetical protein